MLSALSRFQRTRIAALVLVVVSSIAATNGCTYFAQTTRQTQSAPTAAASPVTPEADRITRAVSEPYTGELSIFEDPKRDENLQINRVMDVLKITAGKNVADIGAGSGWFTVRAARRIGDAGKVYAVEINDDYLKYIANRASKEKLGNIQTIRGTEDDPRLPAKSIDAALILKTYHEIAQPVLVMERLREAMKPGARLGVIDRNGSGTDHGIARETVVKEANQAGFKLIEDYDFVKGDGMDYLLVFEAAKQFVKENR